MQSEYNTERKNEDRFYRVGETEVINERISYDRHRDSEESASGYVIDYEARLKDTHPPAKSFMKSDFTRTDIGEVILEQDQETSRESPQFSHKAGQRHKLSNVSAEG